MTKRTLVACFVVVSGTVGIAQVAPSAPPPARSAAIQPRTSIICGIRVFLADPNIDPKMAKPVPPGVFTLRAHRPPVCRDTFATPLAELKQRLPQFLGPKR